jgi:hypothetical protein
VTRRRRSPIIPPPRPIDWPLRPLESAETELHHLGDGRLELRIRHAPLHGITPAMLRWWFLHIEGTVEVQGRTYPRYLVWHPRDHIHWALARPAPDGSAGVGARFRIVEALGRNPAYLVDSVEEVERLDERGIALTRRLLGEEVFRLEHEFLYVPGEGATRYLSCMRLGTASLLGRAVVNRVIRRRLFPEAMGRAWLRHNVEEVGTFEQFLPGLYAQEVG